MLPELELKDNRHSVAIDDASLARLARTIVATLSVAPNGQLLGANTNLLRLLGVNSLSMLLARDFKMDILANPADWEHWERAKSQHRSTVARLELKSADGRAVLLKGDIWYVTDRNKGLDHFFCAFADLTRSPRINTTVRRAVARLNVPQDELPTGSEAILLVTEDALLSAPVRNSLEGLGYTVVMSSLLSGDADSPLQSACDLVIVDAAVTDAIGSIQIVTADQVDMPKQASVLERPFSLRELASAIRFALDGPPNA